MRKFSEIKETYFRDAPQRDTPHKSSDVQQIEEFAKNKSEIIKTWSKKITQHPQAESFKSEVGSAFSREDLEDDNLMAAYDALNDGGILYASWENTFWVKNEKKGKLIRVM